MKNERETTLEPTEQINNGMSLTSLAAPSAAESMFERNSRFGTAEPTLRSQLHNRETQTKSTIDKRPSRCQQQLKGKLNTSLAFIS